MPAAALADGDPASDVLLGQDVFLPYSPISARVQRELYAVTAAARHAGYPLKLALIGSKSDLGVVPTLFRRPAAYARFLSAELAGVASGPVLVVMPDGFGLAVGGGGRSVTGLSGVRIGSGADGLGLAAVVATERLEAAAGHPLSAGAVARAAGSSGGGASSATIQQAVLAMLVLVALAAVGIAAGLRARRRFPRA